jgi:hypothetical protein
MTSLSQPQPIEPVLRDHAFVPIPLALDAILGSVAGVRTKPDDGELAAGRFVERPVGGELYVLPYDKLVL